MAFFNESYTNQQLAILNEKKSTEEYHRRSFKKKYNFEPDKPGSNTGKITVDGKKYDVDIKAPKMQSYTDYPNSNINISKAYFKLKGSNKSERRDAMLQHEIGHQRLHNINPNNKTVDDKNKSLKVGEDLILKTANGTGLNGKSVEERQKYADERHAQYIDSMRNTSKDDEEKRNKSYQSAKKYETSDSHGGFTEYEADRYAANKTSEKAIKRGIKNMYKHIDDNSEKEEKDYAKTHRAEANKEIQRDKDRRSKALKDDELRKADTYK